MMISKVTLPTAAALTGLLFASCAENPADKVEAAQVSDSPTALETTSGEATPAAKDTSNETEGAVAVENATYVFTPDSSIHFIGSKVTGKQEGDFTRFTGHFTVAGDTLASDGTHEVTIDMDSTTTANEKLTAHLKNEDFFDVQKFPTSQFVLNSAEKIEGDNYKLSGQLTLHGITKGISLPATVTGDASLVNVTSEFSINRMDFDIRFPGKPDDLIREEVVIQLNLKAIPGTPQPLALTTTESITAEAPVSPPPAAGRPMGRPSAAPPSLPPTGAPPARPDASMVIKRMDKNGDGKLTAEEAPAGLWERLAESDIDGDGAITPDELNARRGRRPSGSPQ